MEPNRYKPFGECEWHRKKQENRFSGAAAAAACLPSPSLYADGWIPGAGSASGRPRRSGTPFLAAPLRSFTFPALCLSSSGQAITRRLRDPPDSPQTTGIAGVRGKQQPWIYASRTRPARPRFVKEILDGVPCLHGATWQSWEPDGALQQERLRRERPTIPRSQAQVETAERGVNRAATVLEFPVSRRSMPFSGDTHGLAHTLSHFRHRPGVILPWCQVCRPVPPCSSLTCMQSLISKYYYTDSLFRLNHAVASRVAPRLLEEPVLTHHSQTESHPAGRGPSPCSILRHRTLS